MKINYDIAELKKYFDTAATFSSSQKGVTRLFCSKEHKHTIPVIDGWMQEAGLETHLDALGNVVGRKQGKKTSKTLIIGSHQDSVIEGGKYDGILGVLLPLYVLKKMHDAGIELDYSIELIAFGDEEGIRFPETLLGSKALNGDVSLDALIKATDKDGISIYDALKSIGANPDEIAKCKRNKDDVLGFFEAHIEQGPVLEQKGLPVGVVTAITGIQRYAVNIQGKANHAGTTPMNMRQDALVAGAEIIRFADKLFKSTKDLVGVVGELNVSPNAVNVIPDHVDMTIEIRSPHSSLRKEAMEKIAEFFKSIEQEYNVKISYTKNYEMEGPFCDEKMQDQLLDAIKEEGEAPFSLFSGAGHDGLAMINLTPISMLFLRCKDGLSHHFEEEIDYNDAIIAARVIQRFLQEFDYS
ncbi:N-carbamoyl-L-amino acid hydrolase [Candidatus Francisella endociliophora]|uniref:N-carbamoyl-L-amino acid hydrolase n=1 Tax=Candidatus Francisella endociliophora TaxID=653937 RepID=A0A097EQI1_9GAMM|nr:M20 family metallo-hydrolase [Francisella sp. FSC1006]AIT09801.1 N-carbamoyl-L-amino acid hydrolase [Francisella sp. FSC1006]